MAQHLCLLLLSTLIIRMLRRFFKRALRSSSTFDTTYMPHSRRMYIDVKTGMPSVFSVIPKSFQNHRGLFTQSEDSYDINKGLQDLDRRLMGVRRLFKKDIDDLLHKFRQAKTASSSQALTMISCCGELLPSEPLESRTKMAHDVWELMKNLSVDLDISHYNALLGVYLENEYDFSPAEFLCQLQREGIEPDRFTYQLLIARYCHLGDIDGTINILQYMKEKHLPVSEHVFNSLIHGHAQSGNMLRAEGILNLINESGLVPNEHSYFNLMKGYAKYGDIQNIHRICKLCQENCIDLTDKRFLEIIYVLAVNGHKSLIDEMHQYFEKSSGFNADASSVVMRLVNTKQEETAFRVLKMMVRTMNESTYNPVGSFFVRQMVQAETEASTITKYCKDLVESDLNKLAFLRATEYALGLREFNKAFEFLKVLKESGFPIRQHYFWPFFSLKSTATDLLQGMKYMTHLAVQPSNETLQEHIVPACLRTKDKLESSECALERLASYSFIHIGELALAAVQYFLDRKELVEVAKLVAKYHVAIDYFTLRKALVESYEVSLEPRYIALILASARCKGSESLQPASEILWEMFEFLAKENLLKHLVAILQAYSTYGLGINKDTASLIQSLLGKNLSSEINRLLSELSSGALVPRPNTIRQTRQFDKSTVSELEEQYKGWRISNKSLQKSLLLYYCKNMDLEKAQRLQDEMTGEGFVFSPFILMQFLNMYSCTNQLERAQNIASTLETSHSDYAIQDFILLRYLILVAAVNPAQEVLRILNTHTIVHTRDNTLVFNLARKLLNCYAEQGQMEEVKSLFETLQAQKLISKNGIMCEPIIRSHLFSGDSPKAWEEFETCLTKFGCSSITSDLLRSFIKQDDSGQVEKVLAKSFKIHRSGNFDWAVTLAEYGKLLLAKKFTIGIKISQEELDAVCRKYLNEDNLQALHNILVITKQVVDNRCSIYQHLLLLYIKRVDTVQALNLWTLLQEEDIQPPAKFLLQLAEFLKENNVPIPFVIPHVSYENI